VVDTVRKGIVELDLYANAPQELLVGQVAILGGFAGIGPIKYQIHSPDPRLQLLADRSHPFPAARLLHPRHCGLHPGVYLADARQRRHPLEVFRGHHHMETLIEDFIFYIPSFLCSVVSKIAASWFISPLLSGLISSCIYMAVDFAVLRRVNDQQAKRGKYNYTVFNLC
jgi:hypothetical protein